MNLSETGQSRVNGYLFVLERSLKTFLPREVTQDAVREIESHLKERIAASDGAPSERQALEQILSELGPPLRVAQAYSVEHTIEEAVTTGRIVPMARAMLQLAATTIAGFGVALGVFAGYLVSFAFILIAVMKPLVPDNVGLWRVHGDGPPITLGIKWPAPAGQLPMGGYWITPICLFLGLLILVLNYRGTKRFLSWWRSRRATVRA
jgi:amino acid transporter